MKLVLELKNWTKAAKSYFTGTDEKIKMMMEMNP